MGFIKSSTEIKTITSSIIVPETFTHSIAFGQTGCGKTTSFIYPNLQNRLELGHGILLYDYKGKEHLSVKILAEKVGRLDDVIEIGKPWGESINLVENMDEDELDKFFDNILKHGDDNKYWQNSAKSLGQSILKVLKAIDGFSKAMNLVDKEFSLSDEFITADSFEYPKQRTLSSLIYVCNTYEKLSGFIKKLDSLLKKTKNMIENSARESLNKHNSIQSLKKMYKELINARVKLKVAIEETKDSLENFGEDANENLTQNIIGSLTSPLLSLSQNSYFNTNSFDIVSALNDGKIVVINTEGLSGAAVESLNNILMYELSKRTRSTNINPVSVFIDEVQRVVSESTDLPIDVFREAKVDVFLATQNSALLKDKLKSEKFDALMGNLTQKYYFKNSSDEELESENALNLLESFEYVNSEDDYLLVQNSTPLYITNTQKLRVEYKYQKKLNVLSNYMYEYKKEPLVLEYIPRLYADNKLVAIHIKTLDERVLESLNYENISYLESKVDDLFKTIEEELESEDDFLSEYLAS